MLGDKGKPAINGTLFRGMSSGKFGLIRNR